MPEKRIEEIVRRAVEQALDRQLVAVQESVVQEVLREIAPALTAKGADEIPVHAETSTAALQKAVSAIQAGSNQKEILRALLDNTSLYSGRSALFVLKSGAATGWQGTGFSGNDSIKDFVLDADTTLAAKVIQSREAESGTVSEFDPDFIAKFGAPADGKVVLLPLLLKDKISALVYADAGVDIGDHNGDQPFDMAALDVLVRATSAWLEVISQRKLAQKEGAAEAEMHSAPAVSDPFAAHSPVHGKTEAVVESAPAAMSAAAAWGGPTSSPAASEVDPQTKEDSEIHRKAQRFARLLMDEIKLYNQAKVAEGRKHKDLYDRLKEDIDKSRTTYQKRYGSTAAASADYFNQELIRSLAEDDVNLLGTNFRR